MNLIMLSSLTLSLLCFWSFILCVADIVNIIMATSRKRYVFALISLGLFLLDYFIWQIIFDLILVGNTENLAIMTKNLSNLSFILWLTVFIVLTVLTTIIFSNNILYEKNFITPNAIKLYLDKMPCGICCWKDSGRVLFSNICMNNLSLAITNSPLLNGNQFYESLNDEIFKFDNKLWKFSYRETILNGEHLHELIATDISTEYSKIQALEKDKSELLLLNEELKNYTLNIDETVRRQEILQAKVNIHDEMNKLMLYTMSIRGEDISELDKIFSLWGQNALLLCLEADNIKNEKVLKDIQKLAEILKINLKYEDLPSSLNDKERSLFFSATQEAIANAIKHAQANNMEITFSEDENYIYCNFTNDGKMPCEKIKFTGGLDNLSHLAKELKAEILTNFDEKFTLTIKFTSKNSTNG